MKKLLAIALVAGLAGSAVASYESPAWEATASPWGSVSDPANWGGSLPFGSTTGLISSATLSAWGDDWYTDINLRIEGTGIMTTALNAGVPSTTPPTGGGDFALRGGTSAGLTTLFEVAGSTGALNLNVPQFTMWSQFGGQMALSVLSGEVEATSLNFVSGGNGTINMLDGNFHAGAANALDANINMLAGGTGSITWDVINTGVGALYLDFETGNLGNVTFGENDIGESALSLIEWMVLNGRVSIDGVADTALASYNIDTAGTSATLAMIPEPATLSMVALLGGGMLWIRKRFMI